MVADVRMRTACRVYTPGSRRNASSSSSPPTSGPARLQSTPGLAVQIRPARVRGSVCWSRFPTPCRTEAPTEARQGCHRPLKADGYSAAFAFQPCRPPGGSRYRLSVRQPPTVGHRGLGRRRPARVSWFVDPRAWRAAVFSARAAAFCRAGFRVFRAGFAGEKRSWPGVAPSDSQLARTSTDRRLFRRLFQDISYIRSYRTMGSEKSRESH